MTAQVDPKYYPRLIGRRGEVISKIRAEHGIDIQFPERTDANLDVITFTGYEQNCLAARDEILQIVKDYVSLLLLLLLHWPPGFIVTMKCNYALGSRYIPDLRRKDVNSKVM